MRHVLKLRFMLMSLLLMLFTPLVAAASSLESVPQVGAPGIFTAVSVMGLGVGAAITLKAKDATGNRKTILLDTEKPVELEENIDHYAELKVQEATAPITEKLTAAENEGKALRDILVGEILRVRKLTSPKGQDGKESFDVEAEKAYLEGLPAARLKMEFERLPKAEEIKLSQATTAEQPQDPNDPYAGLLA